MAAIHILLPDQSQAVFEDFEIPELLREGRVTPQSYFWQEGMPEWRHLAEFINAHSAVEEPAEETVAAQVEEAKEPAPTAEDFRHSHSERKKGFFATLFGSGLSTKTERPVASPEPERSSRSSSRSGSSSGRTTGRRRSKSRSEVQPNRDDDSTPGPKSAGW